MLSACNLFKKTVVEPGIEKKSTEYLVSKLNESYINYDWFSSRVRFRFQFGGEVLNSTAQLRMKKDSIIWISVTPAFGLEMMRILVTPDSFKVIDRINRGYQSLPYQYISRYMAIDTIDFYSLQKLISGNIIHDVKDYYADTDSTHYQLNNYSQFHQRSVRIIPDIYRPAMVSTEKPAVRQYMKIEYSDYEELESYKFPMKIDISLKMPEIMRISIEHSRVTFVDSPNVSFTVPDSYEKKR